MPYIDSMLFKKKAEKKRLTLVLSDGEDILQSIKAGMLEQGIKECKVEDANGKIKHGLVNFFEGSRFMKKDLKGEAVVKATGSFKLSFDELWGSMHVSVGTPRKLLSATLVNGKAAEGFELHLSFIQEVKAGKAAEQSQEKEGN